MFLVQFCSRRTAYIVRDNAKKFTSVGLSYKDVILFSKIFYCSNHLLVQWLARQTAIQQVPGSIPGYILEIFLEVQGLERGTPSLVRTIWQVLDMRSSEIRLRKLKLRLMDKRFANHNAPCTAIWQQPFQSVLVLWSCSATDLIFNLNFLSSVQFT